MTQSMTSGQPFKPTVRWRWFARRGKWMLSWRWGPDERLEAVFVQDPPPPSTESAVYSSLPFWADLLSRCPGFTRVPTM